MRGAVTRRLTLQRENKRCNDPEHCGADKGAAPSHQALHEQKCAGRDGGADHSGAGVEGEDLRDALRGDAFGQQRVVGGMIHGVGEPHHGEHRDEHPERIDEARHRHCRRSQQQTADQIEARSEVVDKKTDRRLQDRGHHAESGEREAQLGISHAVVVLDEDE